MFRVLPRLAALRVACQQSATVSAHHHSSSSFGYAPITVPLTDNRSLLCRYTSTAAVPPPSPLINIQTGNLANKMWRVKFISLSTSVLGICSQPYLIERSSELMGTVGVVAICGMAGFFAFITPILLHFVVKKYVIGIDYNPITDEYTATTISFFMQKNKTTFKTSDITVPEVPGMFTSFKVGKGQVPLFVEPTDFVDIHHYARFMGYDKPVDFKLNQNAGGSKKEN